MHQYITLEDTVYFGFAANLTSGAAGDGATPLFDVRLGGAAAGAIPTLSGTPTLLTHANYTDGCYEVAIAATAANGFAANSTYLVFVTLTIDSVTPAAMIGSFRTAPVPANVTQLAGVAQSLTDLKDFADDGYDPATNKVQGAVLVDTITTYTGNTVQTGDSFTRIGAAGAGLTAIDLPNQTMDITGNITGNLSGSVGSVTGAVGSVTGAVGSVTGAVGSVTGNVGGNVVGSVAGDVVGSVGGNVLGSVGSVTVVSDKTGYALSAAGSAAMTEGYPTLGGTGTLPQILYAILQHLEEVDITGLTKTVKKRDQATTAETLTLNSATAPTSVTRAT